MATIAQIRADLVGSSASFRAEMIAGQRQANESLQSIRREVTTTATSITTLNKAAAGLVGFEAIKGGVQSLLDAQKAAQQVHYSLVSATGSTTAADAAYKAVSATAEQLGLDLRTSALGFSSMSAAASANGVAMHDQQALFEGLARSATVLHLSSEQTGRAITALSQIFGKGKIQAEELRQQLGDAIPGVVPRFQQAVMAMTRGTDLAGKSFDQLLQSGDITVQRFLPALIQSLNDTGRGAEQAAGGLNASVNRLSSEWFRLKTDLSGGLFSDAATASIDLVTHNLEHLADVAGITGGLVVARLAGGGLGKASSGASALVQQQQEARAAAVAATELASAQATAAAAEIKQNEAALAGVASARAQAAAQRDAAAAALQKALAENEAAQATLNHQRTAATLSANTRAQRIATTEAAAAQAALSRAQVQYNASAQASIALKAQQIELEGALFRARGAATLATEAEVAAERQLATTSAAGLLARGASGLGNFALGLVGGPWGAAVAAIGAVGYAIYDTQKRAEDYRKETDELSKSVKQLREEAETAAKSFGVLDGSMTFKQGIEQYKQESAAIAEQRSALSDLEAQADAIRARIASRSNGTAGGAFANLLDQRELDGVNERIEALQSQLGPATAAVDALGNKMSGVLAPSIGDVKKALAELANGKSLLDVVFDLSSGADKGIASADAALASLRAGLQVFQAGAKDLADKAATDGLNNAQKAAYLYQQRLKDIAKLPAGQQSGARATLDQDYAPYLEAAKRLDAADAAKKAASAATSQAKQYAEATQRLIDEAKQHSAVLAEQADGTQKLTESQAKLAAFEQELLTTKNKSLIARAAEYRAILQENAAKEVAQRQAQEEAAALARSIALRDQLSARIDRQNEANALAVAGVGHGQELTQQLQDELRIRQEYDRQRQQYDKQAGQLKPGVAGSVGSKEYNEDVARMFASQQQELAIYRAGVQQRLDAEKDWSNGAQAALEDYVSSANDVAGQTKQAFSDAFGGLEDALVTFVQTGKLSFTDLANSIIADIARMQVKAAASGLFQVAANAIGAYFGGGSGGSVQSIGGDTSYLGNSYNTGQYGGGFNLGGGRAGGGSTSAGTLYEVAEHGPELYQSGGRSYLLSGKDGYVTPAGSSRGATSAGAGGGLIVNITNTQGDKVQATAKESKGPGGARQLDIMIDAVEAKIAGNVSRGQGPLSSALSSRYSLNKGQNI
ncbi:phage tail tape measure protein [Luteibacter flocculans]|uniref:Phage tail tape measure protein n=1 Tax=Luteibacter flocculans TaxID=2780091 RepID=A0ABY4T8G2_9GAMM|nr:phage tail tape measure protein [Luteibacter flocculans]URL59625.1 phage tail tape measure protein [Luteibacter flocculans]